MVIVQPCPPDFLQGIDETVNYHGVKVSEYAVGVWFLLIKCKPNRYVPN